MRGEKGITLLTTYIDNESTIPQTLSTEATYTTTQSSSWKASIGYELGVSATVEAGIPSVGKGSVSKHQFISFFC